MRYEQVDCSSIKYNMEGAKNKVGEQRVANKFWLSKYVHRVHLCWPVNGDKTALTLRLKALAALDRLEMRLVV